ncbi:MAG: IS256 family transposase [Desulfocapsa sp.]|nr:MAG: IS256 family transposase [Desulfocapsa sp.]
MTDTENTAIAEILKLLISDGPDGMAHMFTTLFNLAMRLEREQYLHAGPYERSSERTGFANGFKSKKIDTPVGTLRVEVPQSRGADEPFYPQSLERGCRSSRALQAAIAEMYVQGVSTRDVEKVMGKLGLESLSSSQVSKATKTLDEELKNWNNRPLGEVCYLLIDARYEKLRVDGVVRDVAVFSAIGIGPDGHRSLLGVSVDLSEAEVHWRSFLQTLVTRGMRGVRYIVSDDHAGLKAARKAVFGGTLWQRCQYHLSQNAIHHSPNHKIRKEIGGELRAVWNAKNMERAKDELKQLVDKYREKHPKLASWLEENVPESMTVFTLPENHRKRMRTSNAIERAVQQEIKRRTSKIRIFPNEASLLRLVTAILVEQDEKWSTARKKYINWNTDEA